MKIYTKTGDAGETGLLGGGRVPKDAPRIEAIGAVDELNAAIGVARCHGHGGIADELAEIQARLFDLGSELAAPDPESAAGLSLISGEDHVALEEGMDRMTARLEPLRNFILPGGGPLAAHLHMARSVCRRAERRLLSLARVEPVRPEIQVYLNRLGDWLFTAARTANADAGVVDVKWSRKGDKRS